MSLVLKEENISSSTILAIRRSCDSLQILDSDLILNLNLVMLPINQGRRRPIIMGKKNQKGLDLSLNELPVILPTICFSIK